ncbi:MAG: hypothetical protein E7351_03825 [Clostridiales bacterium]|nr:hypothetical protein [Clostridiales bacterium]
MEFKSVLFLGIGGVSMHQLAIAFNSMGVKVYGFDVKASRYTELCEQNGIEVVHRFVPEYTHVDLCIKTGAIKSGKYIDRLKAVGCPIVDRAEALGWLCTRFKTVIAVAGTHGKSTTATLIYEILKSANMKVSCHVGADVYDARFEVGDDYLVVEACEYNKSFLSLYPKVSVVTNVEAEHLDSYGSLFNLRTAFFTFLKRGKKRFVYEEKSTEYLKKNKNINFVDIKSEKLLKNPRFNPKIKGEHNLKNIALAVAVTQALGVDEDTILKALNSFVGIPRRYEYVGVYGQSRVYIDYAHHPTEVRAFIDTFSSEASEYQIIFQPHTFSRTKILLKDFLSVFKNIKNLILYKEYPAREKAKDGMSAKDLYDRLKEINPNVKYCANATALEKNLGKNMHIAFVGAGDIDQIAKKIIKTN